MTSRLSISFSTLSIIALLATNQPLMANPELEQVVDGSGLSGSFLSARIASFGNDDVAAVRFLEKAIELDPKNNRLKRNLFHAYLANGRIEDAVELSREIGEEDSNGNVITIVEGVEHIRKRSWTKAAETMEQVTGSDLDSLIGKVTRSWALYGEGNVPDGLKLLAEIEGAEWVSTIRLLHRGLMFAASGDDEKAQKELAIAVANRAAAGFLSETYIHAVDALSRSQQRADLVDDAKKTIAAGLDIFPNHPTLLSRKSEIEESREAQLLISTPQQGAAELFFNIGNAIGREGGTPFAKIYLQIAHHLNSDSAEIAISLASVFERQKDPERANSFYAGIKEGSSLKRRALLETAINLNTLKDIEGSIKIMRELIESEPSDLVPYLTLGRLFNQHERYQEASEIFEAAVKIVPNPTRRHWDLFYRRAISYERLKNWDKAEVSFKKALELDPNRANVLNYLGYSWVDMGINLDEGLDMIRKAVKLRPRAGFIVDSLGWAYYKLGRYEEAVVELEKAVGLLPQDPVVNDHLGDSYWRVGRRLEATFQWKHALDNKPTKEEKAKIAKKLEDGLVDVSSNDGSTKNEQSQ